MNESFTMWRCGAVNSSPRKIDKNIYKRSSSFNCPFYSSEEQDK